MLGSDLSFVLRHLAATPPFALVAGRPEAPELPLCVRNPYVQVVRAAATASMAQVTLTCLPPPGGYAKRSAAADESHQQINCSTVVVPDALVGGVYEFELSSEKLAANLEALIVCVFGGRRP